VGRKLRRYGIDLTAGKPSDNAEKKKNIFFAQKSFQSLYRRTDRFILISLKEEPKGQIVEAHFRNQKNVVNISLMNLPLLRTESDFVT
jgi:hypothetical protein